MTTEELLDLDGIPQMWGAPLYPHGMPMRLESITWKDGETLQQKWLNHCRRIFDTKPPDPEAERLLKNWVIYYLHAPMWNYNKVAYNNTVRPLLQKNLLDMTLSQLIDECLQIGIDPL
jgi:hypothetical protein